MRCTESVDILATVGLETALGLLAPVVESALSSRRHSLRNPDVRAGVVLNGRPRGLPHAPGGRGVMPGVCVGCKPDICG